MRVLFATAELAPIAAVGGLAHAAAGLTAELRRQGVDVDIVLPDYTGTDLAGARTRSIVVPDWAGPATVRVGAHAVAGELHLVRDEGDRPLAPVPAPRRDGVARQRRTVPRLLPRDRRAGARGPARRAAPQRLAHRGRARRAGSSATECALAAQPRLPGGDRGGVAPPSRAAGRALRVVGRDEPVVGGDRPRRQGGRRLAQLRRGNTHARGRVRPRRPAASPLGRRERDPQRDRPGHLEPGHRSSPAGDVRHRRRRRRGARRQGRPTAAPSRPVGDGPTTTSRSPRW